MRARVTAVLVASNGADYLPRTLDALKAQTRQPDSVIVVDVGSSDTTPALLSAARPTHFISASGRLSFGTAVAHALGVVPPPEDENEWLWLLAHDTAPEPDALAALLAAVEVNPSVAAAGPKQMDWEHPDYISEFGETLTRFGATYAMAETELDQAQHDRMSDVLGVGAAGMLVRHTVWNDLKGFDAALPTADNGLDFSVRVRLAGHRVMGVPAARIASAGVGLAGPGAARRGGPDASARRIVVPRSCTAASSMLRRSPSYSTGSRSFPSPWAAASPNWCASSRVRSVANSRPHSARHSDRASRRPAETCAALNVSAGIRSRPCASRATRCGVDARSSVRSH